MNRLSAPAWFYVVRGLLLAAAGASIALAVWLSRDRQLPPTEAEGTFACPMHPEVVAAAAGECPICRMALERQASAGAPSMPPGGMLPGTFLLRPGVRGLTPYDLVKARRLDVARWVVAPAWLESPDDGVALVYRDEPARSTSARFACRGAEADARVVVESTEPRDEMFVRVRFHLAPGDETRRPGDVGWLRLSIAGAAVTVPYSAVLESPSGPVVFVASADGRTLAKRTLVLSRLYFGQATVVSGLAEGEAVAVSPFAMSAEERLSTTAGDRPKAAP